MRKGKKDGKIKKKKAFANSLVTGALDAEKQTARLSLIAKQNREYEEALAKDIAAGRIRGLRPVAHPPAASMAHTAEAVVVRPPAKAPSPAVSAAVVPSVGVGVVSLTAVAHAAAPPPPPPTAAGDDEEDEKPPLPLTREQLRKQRAEYFAKLEEERKKKAAETPAAGVQPAGVALAAASRAGGSSTRPAKKPAPRPGTGGAAGAKGR